MTETLPLLSVLLCCGGSLFFGALLAFSLFILKHGCNLFITILVNALVTLLLLMGLIIALYVNGFDAACEAPLLGTQICTWVDLHLIDTQGEGTQL